MHYKNDFLTSITIYINMVFIVICGKLGSGKDFIARNVISPCLESFVHLNFSDQIKMNVIVKNNILYNDVFVAKTSLTRKLLQTEGTERGRDKYGSQVWINYYDNWKKTFESRGCGNVICTDVRFENEFSYCKSKNAFIIKVVSPELNHAMLMKESGGNEEMYNSIKNHISETNLDHYDDTEYDMVINNYVGISLDSIKNEFMRRLENKHL